MVVNKTETTKFISNLYQPFYSIDSRNMSTRKKLYNLRLPNSNRPETKGVCREISKAKTIFPEAADFELLEVRTKRH